MIELRLRYFNNNNKKKQHAWDANTLVARDICIFVITKISIFEILILIHEIRIKTK